MARLASKSITVLNDQRNAILAEVCKTDDQWSSKIDRLCATEHAIGRAVPATDEEFRMMATVFFANEDFKNGIDLADASSEMILKRMRKFLN